MLNPCVTAPVLIRATVPLVGKTAPLSTLIEKFWPMFSVDGACVISGRVAGLFEASYRLGG